MNLILPHLNVLILFLSGVAVAVVLFVAIGLLLDLVPRDLDKQQKPRPPRRSWLWRFLHLRASN